jgi:outer membrane protein insertion porin family
VTRLALILSCVLVAGACDDEFIPPKTPPKILQKEASPAERREAACKAKELPQPPPIKATEGAVDIPQGTVAKIDVEGADEGRVRQAIGITVGEALSTQKTQEALRRLYQLGDFDDVRLEAQKTPAGVALHFAFAPRAKLGEVVIHGGTVVDVPELESAFHATSGAKYDPAAIVIARTALVGALRQKGYADALLNVVGERAADGKVDLCVDLREGSKVTVESVAFHGLVKVKEDELKSLVDTDHGRINTPGGILDPMKIDDAVAKMAEVLDTHGLAKGTIQTKTTRTGDKVAIVFEVEEGPVILLRRYDVKGDTILDASAYRKVLSLKSKDPFSRAKLLADIQKIGELHDKANRKDLQVQPQTQPDDKNNTVDVVLFVIDPKKVKQAPPPPPPAKP